MKEYKKVIIGIIIGGIIASSITAYAYSYLASDVKYTNDTSVADALDDLYSKTNELNTLKSNINQTDATASDILNGKKAYTKNGLITGTYIQTTTKGTEWNAGTITTTANSTNSIDVGFVPNTVIIFNIAGATNGKMMYDTNWGNNLSVLCSSGGISTYRFGDSYTTNDTYILSVGTTVTFYTHNANTWRWIAIK